MHCLLWIIFVIFILAIKTKQSLFFLRFSNKKLEKSESYNFNFRKVIKMDFMFALNAINRIQNNSTKTNSNIKVFQAISNGGFLYITIFSNFEERYTLICNPLSNI